MSVRALETSETREPRGYQGANIAYCGDPPAFPRGTPPARIVAALGLPRLSVLMRAFLKLADGRSGHSASIGLTEHRPAKRSFFRTVSPPPECIVPRHVSCAENWFGKTEFDLFLPVEIK